MTPSLTSNDGNHMKKSAPERVEEILSAPGPYVSVYLDITPGRASASEQLHEEREKLINSGVDLTPFEIQFNAIKSNAALTTALDVGGWCAIAGADGSAITMTGAEPPRANLVALDSFPHVGPMLEWGQAQVAHTIISLGSEVVEALLFVVGEQPEVRQIGHGAADAAPQIEEIIKETGSELVVIVTQPSAHEAAIDLQAALEILPSSVVTSVVVQEDDDTTGDLADAVVRLVADQTATTTVDALETHRQFSSLGRSVEGLSDTRTALLDGSVELLLIHDDPDDLRRIESGALMGAASTDGFGSQTGRLNDVLIAVALSSDARVHIVPNTQKSLRSGIGAILRDGGVRDDAVVETIDAQAAEKPLPTSAKSLSRQVVESLQLAEAA